MTEVPPSRFISPPSQRGCGFTPLEPLGVLIQCVTRKIHTTSGLTHLEPGSQSSCDPGWKGPWVGWAGRACGLGEPEGTRGRATEKDPGLLSRRAESQAKISSTPGCLLRWDTDPFYRLGK